MDIKKVLLVTDGTRDPKVNEMREDVQPIYRVVEKYGATLEIVADDGLTCEGALASDGMIKMEKEGPNWVKHSQEYLDKIADADMIIISYSAAGKQFFEHAKNLKFLGVMRGGVENVDVEEATKRNIPVCFCPGRASEATSDMAVALMMTANRGIVRVNKIWQPGVPFGRQLMNYMPSLMKDTTIGLVGFGMVAKKVAEKLSGFKCPIISYDPFVSQEVADKYNVKMVSLDELMSQSDIVSVHVRMTPQTMGIIGRKQIELMKPTSFFINTARAGLIDEEALLDALKNKKIRGAALDVFNAEPLPDDDILHQLDNVIITPHLAGGAGDTVVISGEIMFDEVKRYLDGKPLLNQVNKIQK